MDGNKVSGSLVIGLGELLWDVFPGGTERLGGAPTNVAYHATALGDRGVIATRVGRDRRGDAAIEALDGRGVETSWVQRDGSRSTGTAVVTAGRAEASFVIDEEAAWCCLEWNQQLQELFEQADAIVFGSLLQSSTAGRAVLEAAVDAAADNALRVLDLNLRPPHDDRAAIEAALAAANVVKLNEAELGQLARNDGIDQEALVGRLLAEQNIELVAITHGARGCRIMSRAGAVTGDAHPLEQGRPSDADSVGAGDAFTATLVFQLLRGASIDRAAVAACRYAAFVASRPGAMPAPPRWLIQEVTRR